MKIAELILQKSLNDKFKGEEIIVETKFYEASIEAIDQALSIQGVSISLLKKAYDLIPDGTSHNDLIEIKQKLFSNEC